MFEEVMKIVMEKGPIFYIGCSLIPTPPSPCPDFGLQFVVVVVIGLLSPKPFVRPIYLLFRKLGRLIKETFIDAPVIGWIVGKSDQLLQKWFRFLKKDRTSENRVVEKLYETFLREDLIERLIFGYFVTILLGILFMGLAIYI